MKKIVDENGKTYVEKKPFYKKWWFWLLVIVLVGGGAGSQLNKPQKVGEKPVEQASGSEKQDEPSSNAPEVFKVGDIIKDGDLEVVINSAQQTNEGLVAPEEGKAYFVIDATITNTGDKKENISSILMFELKDAEGRNKDMAFGVDTNGSLDGEILPSEKLTGQLAYEVDAEGELNLYINLSVFGGNTIKINVR